MSERVPELRTPESGAEELGDAHRWGELAGGLTAADPLLAAAVGTAAEGGASYADVRLSETEELRLYAVSGLAPDERIEGSLGLGVRVLVDGVWGFASRPLRDSGDAAAAARDALRNAQAAAVGSRERVTLPPRAAECGFYQTTAAVDPFAVDAAARERVVADALAAAAAMAGVVRVQAGVNAKRSHRYFASTEGSRQEQHFVESGGMVLAIAAGDQIVQRRSYPNSFHGNTAAAGWEYVAGLRLTEQAARVGAEAVQLLSAPVVDSGTADIIIGPAQLALQIHESTGHALELDRILGDEANFAGRSFIGPDAVGQLRYGSPAVNVVADATVPGTRGSFMFDDEGTRTRRTMLITEGMISNFLSSRDSAARIGAESTAAARSDGWGFLPLCFATNVFLEPGTCTTDELLDRMGNGYYLDDNRSWSIDSQRLNFQFGTEVAWEVRNGKRGRLVRDFSYGGITPQFWGSFEASAGPAEFATFGMPCGKGEPKEWGFLSHGAAPSLFRNVRIGVA
ncbi:MAG TPA: TldD/PmbA family protein [Streptosporangiaceae bacterium]|nr:TldD/PmbA family protein [Streptosporangiaceae bacterium]